MGLQGKSDATVEMDPGIPVGESIAFHPVPPSQPGEQRREKEIQRRGF